MTRVEMLTGCAGVAVGVGVGVAVGVGVGVAACTVTENVARPVLPAASVAEQVTLVVPIGNLEPEAGLQVTATLPLTASDAVGGVYVTVAPSGPVAVVVTLAGTLLRAGGVVSRTLMVNVAEARFPAESRALHITVAAPSAKVEPDAGVHVTDRKSTRLNSSHSS